MDIKVIDGILCWRCHSAEDYVPFTKKGLTTLILAYEAELQQGVNLWKEIKYYENNPSKDPDTVQELADRLTIWIEGLKYSFTVSQQKDDHVEILALQQINLN